MYWNPRFSIIIPIFNEASIVGEAITNYRQLKDVEIILADGGSCDGTLEIAEAFSGLNPNIFVTHASKSRGLQINAGARQAHGEWLIILHADTFLPVESFRSMVQHIDQFRDTCVGAFTLQLNGVRFCYRYLEGYARWRSKIFKLPFGDQGLFIRKSVFDECGGFRDDYPIMEDVEFVRRLQKKNRFIILDAPVYSSVRRYEKNGYLKRSFINLSVQTLYACGVHPKRLVAIYDR